MEFWGLDVVVSKVGLSRSEIYRRQKLRQFPQSRAYRNSTRRFWLSTDVRQWQREELAGGPVDDVEGLIG